MYVSLFSGVILCTCGIIYTGCDTLLALVGLTRKELCHMCVLYRWRPIRQ